MNKSIKVAAVLALMAVSACTESGIDDANSVDLNAPVVGSDSGLLTDQNSPAYFQQAIGDRVLFLVDQSGLTDEARSILSAQASWLINNPAYSAVIEGHADEQGTREYNLALGARRANSAREYIISQGVSGDRVKVVSYGKERPLEICSEESCYAKNRRAVTVLSSDLTG